MSRASIVRLLFVPAAGLGIAAAFQGTAVAQNIRLSGPLARSVPGGPVVGDVLAFQTASGVGRVVYRADQDVDQVFELYSARLDGAGTPVRLAPALAADGNVTVDFAVSPDGAFVVFEHFSHDQFRRLYAVPTRGGAAPIPLDVLSSYEPPFLFDAGGTRVVYRRGGAAPGAFNLCSVPLDGSQPPVKLHPSWPAIPAERTVEEFELAPDGTEVLFVADHGATSGKMELYAAPIDGSAAPRRLSADLDGDFGVSDFHLAPDGRSVLYRANEGDLFHPKPTHLYTASTDGSRPVERLSVLPGLDFVGVYQITSDGRTVVFEAEKSPRRDRLYSAPVAGRRPPHGVPGGPLHHDPVFLTAMASDEAVFGWQLGADGSRVVYQAGNTFTGSWQLYSVLTNGSDDPVQLNRPLGSSERVQGFAVAPEGDYVVYEAGDGLGGDVELYRVPVAGGPSLDYGTLALPSLVSEFRIAPDSSFVLYRGYTQAFDALKMFAVPFDGSAFPCMLSDALPPGQDVASDFVPLPRGRVLYRADQAADEVFELFEGFAGRLLPAPRLR